MCTRNSWIVVVAVVAIESVVWSCQRQAPPAASAPTSAASPPAPAAPPAAPAASPPPAAPPAPAAPGTATGSQRVAVQVTEEGFVPARIPAQVGKPITLAITRKTDKTCAREILFKGQPGKTDLPLGREVEVVYTPKASGAVAFGCAMGMMIGGTLDVR